MNRGAFGSSKALIALIAFLVAMFALVLFGPWWGSDDEGVLVSDADELMSVDFAQPIPNSKLQVEISSLFGRATSTDFAAAQTVELAEGQVEVVQFRTPSNAGLDGADVVVRVGVYSGDPMTGLDGLQELGSTELKYTRIQEASVHNARFDPAIKIPDAGEYVVVLELMSAEPNLLGGYEPITVVSGDAYPAGRGFNLRSDGVTNVDLWSDLDYLISLGGSASIPRLGD
jgi:hypothetical protein